jgi:hypothetical protein
LVAIKPDKTAGTYSHCAKGCVFNKISPLHVGVFKDEKIVVKKSFKM